MAAEIIEIPDSEYTHLLSYLDGLHEELHTAIRLLQAQGRDLSALKAELDSFAPVLAQFKGGVSYMALRRAKAVSRLAVQED
jgi:hypothetical protein